MTVVPLHRETDKGTLIEIIRQCGMKRISKVVEVDNSLSFDEYKIVKGRGGVVKKIVVNQE